MIDVLIDSDPVSNTYSQWDFAQTRDLIFLSLFSYLYNKVALKIK